jgi:hypothetical protein
VVVKLQAFLTWTLGEGKQSASRSHRFTSGKEPSVFIEHEAALAQEQ